MLLASKRQKPVSKTEITNADKFIPDEVQFNKLVLSSTDTQNSTNIKMPKKRKPAEHIPHPSIRYDQLDHIAIKSDRQRCKNEECNYKSFIMCQKCNVHLCDLNGTKKWKERKCFEKFHTLEFKS